jgi:hypothetical protein
VCIAVWKQLWWDTLGRKILHPDCPIKTHAILGEASKLAHKDINQKCLEDVMKEMETSLVFVDERVIAGVAEAIVEYYKTL